MPASIQAMQVPDACDQATETPSKSNRWFSDCLKWAEDPPPDRFFPIGYDAMKLAQKMMSNLDPKAAADVESLARNGSEGDLRISDEERPLRLTQARLLQTADCFTAWAMSMQTSTVTQTKRVKQIAAELNTMATMKRTIAKTELDAESPRQAKKIELLADHCQKDAKVLRDDGRKPGRRSLTPLEKIQRHFDQLAVALAGAKQLALSKRVRAIQHEFEAAERLKDGSAEALP